MNVALYEPKRTLILDEQPLVELYGMQHVAGRYLVPHNEDNTRLLHESGTYVPTPIETYYNWPGIYKPLSSQLVMAPFMTLYPRCYNFGEQGIAKTAAALWATDWLMLQGLVQRTVILAPLSVLRTVWFHDIFHVLPHRQAIIAHGTAAGRVNAINSVAEFIILNHDGVRIEEVMETIRKDQTIDNLIVDEGDAFRNARTTRWRQLRDMVRPDMRVIWMTGTPFPQAPSDAWAQARIVTPGNVPKYFSAFREATMYKKDMHHYAPRPDGFETAAAACQPAIRLKKRDYLDLPELSIRDWEVELTDEQRKAFESMRKTFAAELKAADDEGVEISAVNAADKLSKLRQILCGGVKAEDGSYVILPHGPHLHACHEAIEHAQAKVLIVVPFKGITYALAEELNAAYGAGSFSILNGDVPIKKRDDIVMQFKNEKLPMGLVCHPQVMSHGLNLVEADTLLMYAPIYSNSQYLQVLERFNRSGQVNHMNVIRLVSHPLEASIYDTLSQRAETQESILQLYRKVLTGKI